MGKRTLTIGIAPDSFKGSLTAMEAALNICYHTCAKRLRAVPEELLLDTAERDGFADAQEARTRYGDYLELRVSQPRAWLARAAEAKAHRLAHPPARLEARR